MRLALIFSAASVINLLLFWFMIQMVTAEHGKQWVRTTDARYFDFVRQRPKPETLARSQRKTPPKPEPQAPETFSEPMARQAPSAENLRALPLPAPALKVEIPASARMNIGTGPSLPPVISGGGRSKTGALGRLPGAGSGSGSGAGPAAPAFIMADRLTAISRVQPLYPEQLRFRRIEGEVVVEFTVTPEGTVSDPTIISSKPAGSFDRSALQAVRRWRFKPHRDAQGNPISVRARQIFSFTLDR